MATTQINPKHQGKRRTGTKWQVILGIFGGNGEKAKTHIWIIVHSGDQVVDEGLQGAGHQVVVMVEETWVAVVFALEQVLVVAAGVELPSERRCLRHVVLQGATRDTAGWSGSGEASGVFFFQTGADAVQPTEKSFNTKKIASSHNKCERAEFCSSGRSDAVDSLPAADTSGEFLGLFSAVG